jgi:hypothetical protein
MRVRHAMWLQRIDTKIAAVRKRQAEQEHGQRSRPRPPDWVVQLGIGVGHPPVQIHTGDCHMKGTRLRPVDRDEARSLLTPLALQTLPEPSFDRLGPCGVGRGKRWRTLSR